MKYTNWILALSLAVSAAACSPGASRSADRNGARPATSGATRQVPQLPAPFQNVRIGASRVDVLAAYPGVSDAETCAEVLLGRAPSDDRPPSDAPAPEGPHSRCINDLEVAGTTTADIARFLRAATLFGGERGTEEGVVLAGLVRTQAQVRGAIRAGVISELDAWRANGDRDIPARQAVFRLSLRLASGALAFTEGLPQLRFTVAMLPDDGCEVLDAHRLRAFVEGRTSLSQIRSTSDRAARRCGRALIADSGALAGQFLVLSGGLGPVGLPYAQHGQEAMTEPETSKLSELRRRTSWDDEMARLAIRLGREVPRVEQYWSGGVVLYGPAQPKGAPEPAWGNAIVWFRDGRVSRIVLNIGDEEQLESLRGQLASLYSAPGTVAENVTTWRLPGGASAKLDTGGALALSLE